MILRIVCTLIIASLICSGCGRKIPQAVEDQPAPVQLLFGEIQTLMEQDNSIEAIARLEKALTEEQFQNDKPQIFTAILSIRVQTGQTDQAITRHLSILESDPELAAQGYPVIEQALSGEELSATALDWTSKLLESRIEPQTRSRIYIFRSRILMKEGRDSEVIEILSAVMEKLDPAWCAPALRSILDLFQSAGKLDGLESAIGRIETLNREQAPDIIKLTTSARLRLLMAREDWQGFLNMCSTKLTSIDDNDADSLIRASYTSLKDKDPSTAEKICGVAVKSLSSEQRSFFNACRYWLTLNSTLNPASIPDCINTIRTAGLNDQKVYYIIRDPYYAVLSSKQPETLKELLTVLTDIREELTSEQDINVINNMLLDGSFILKDYDTAISMLEQGIGGKDDAWRKSAISKLKAHKALDAGQLSEAVNHFREFMNAISDSMESETDPVSGMTYTKTWCLARNAKRIGDLLKEQGLQDQAAAAYAEAQKYFTDAITEFKEDSREHAALIQEKSEIPAG